MANFLSDAMGSDGVAKMAGQKVGKLVEDTVKNTMGGKKKEKQEGGGGFGVGDALSFMGGKKENKQEGGGGEAFGVGDALSLVTGKKNDSKGGFNIGNVLQQDG